MTMPLVVLAGFSIVAGLLNLPFTKGLHFLEHWLEPALAHEHVVTTGAATKWLLAFIAIAAGVIGIAVAYRTYIERRVDADRFERPVLAQAWYYDRTVSDFMGGPGRRLFDAITWFDANVIDGAVNAAAAAARGGGNLVRKAQSGYVRSYALGMSLGSVALLVWFVLRISS
jgi:NADH-quinone oxidoreductase subunit L